MTETNGTAPPAQKNTEVVTVAEQAIEAIAAPHAIIHKIMADLVRGESVRANPTAMASTSEPGHFTLEKGNLTEKREKVYPPLLAAHEILSMGQEIAQNVKGNGGEFDEDALRKLQKTVEQHTADTDNGSDIETEKAIGRAVRNDMGLASALKINTHSWGAVKPDLEKALNGISFPNKPLEQLMGKKKELTVDSILTQMEAAYKAIGAMNEAIGQGKGKEVEAALS